MEEIPKTKLDLLLELEKLRQKIKSDIAFYSSKVSQLHDLHSTTEKQIKDLINDVVED